MVHWMSKKKKKKNLSTIESTPCYKYSPSKVLKNNLARYNCLAQLPWHHTPWKDQYNTLIDVSLPNLGNLQTAYAKKMRKYEELGIEVRLANNLMEYITLCLDSTNKVEQRYVRHS